MTKRPARFGYVYFEDESLHRIVWKSRMGYIPHGWEVHHIDADPTNNSFDNLVALPAAYHRHLHKDGGSPPRSVLIGVYERLITKYERLICQWKQLEEQVKNIEDELGEIGVDIGRPYPKSNEATMRANRNKLKRYYDTRSVAIIQEVDRQSKKVILRKA